MDAAKVVLATFCKGATHAKAAITLGAKWAVSGDFAAGRSR